MTARPSKAPADDAVSPTPRAAPRGVRTRAALISAATELVAEVGYLHATTKAIAERAGVAEGTIYRHFPDKRTLFTAAILESHRDLVQWMERLPDRAGRGDVATTLTDTLAYLSTLREAIVPLEVAMASAPGLRPQHAGSDLSNAVHDLGGPPARLAEYLHAEQALGRVRPDIDPTYTAIVLLAALFGLQTSPLAPPTGLTRDDIGKIVDVVVRGIIVAAHL